MGANLIETLSQVKDFRKARGQRYPLWLVLLLVMMGTISGFDTLPVKRRRILGSSSDLAQTCCQIRD
ncbi:hypothetical protein [Microseira sp. BLCC-F43]|jgi:hypothetical protein|uniref:hypothetical protein n=1 Tax=Microseira sp. BLCC-F43 TaxID=3153602 RepID=UPI0035B7E09F